MLYRRQQHSDLGQRGAVTAEYALLLGMITVALVLAIAGLLRVIVIAYDAAANIVAG